MVNGGGRGGLEMVVAGWPVRESFPWWLARRLL